MGAMHREKEYAESIYIAYTYSERSELKWISRASEASEGKKEGSRGGKDFLYIFLLDGRKTGEMKREKRREKRKLSIDVRRWRCYHV